MTTEPEPLPGLEDLTPTAGSSAGSVERAVRRTIVALHSGGKVAEVDAGRLALALSMAQVIEAKQRSGRMSTIAMDARVLLDALNGLTGGEEGEDDAALAAAMQAWEEEVRRQEAAARDAGSST